VICFCLKPDLANFIGLGPDDEHITRSMNQLIFALNHMHTKLRFQTMIFLLSKDNGKILKHKLIRDKLRY